MVAHVTMDRKKYILRYVLVLISLACYSEQYAVPRSVNDEYFENGAVATDVPQCSAMGRNILVRNGSAVDAAITSLLCIGVVNPESSGLGGGLSMVVYKHETQTVRALMALEKAPGAAHSDMFSSRTASKYGVNSIAVPGELRGMWEAHQQYGVLPWADLFEPVIEMAENGFALTKHVPYVLGLSSMQQYTEIQKMYEDNNGDTKLEGCIQYTPKLAATLRKIAANGVDEFYAGSVAEDLVQDIQDEVQGGASTITADDLMNYSVSWEPVESTTFNNGVKMYSTPLTASGPVLQYILNVLDEYNITSDDFTTTTKKTLLYHRFLEATKFGFALRSHLGDNLSSPLVIKVLNAMRSKQFAAETANEINDAYVTYTNRHDYDISDDIPDEEQGVGDTSHVSVVAANGDAVSVTSSIGIYFGSRFYSNRTGLFLNNHMANFYFSSRESNPIWNLPSANGIEPGRMYMTTTCPSMLMNSDGSVKMVVGASGGSRIISANAWVILRALWTGASMEDAIEERRIHHWLSSSNTAYEERFSQQDRFSWTIRSNLKDDMGHTVKYSSQYACVQGILTDDQGGMYAHSDSRKGGLAAGY